MGIQVSKTQVSGGNYFMKPGDTFLYSVEDPRGRMIKAGVSSGKLSELSSVTINRGDEGKKHMMYEGRVENLVVRNGKVHYQYSFDKMWTTPDRFRNSGQGVVGPWTWSRFGKSSWYQKTYFGDKNNSPSMLSIPPKGSEFPANHTNNGSQAVHSLAAPKEIPSDDPNLAVNGDFSRLSNQEILQFLSNYAMNASYTGRTSVPEVQEIAKEFLPMSKSQLESTYKRSEAEVLNRTQGSMITITYKTQDGMPESERMSLQSFLEKGIQVIKDKNNVREYTGLIADRGAEYDTIYKNEKETIEDHRKDFVGANGFGEEAIMSNIEIKGGNLSFTNPRTDIPFVNVNDPLDTDQIMKDTGYAQIQNILRNNPAIEGWTQVKEIDTNGNEKVNTFFYNNVSMNNRVVHDSTLDVGSKVYVSGMSRGAKRLDVVGSENKRVGQSPYFSVRETRKDYPEKTLETLKKDRLRFLGMLDAYIQNNHSIRGTGGVLDMMRGGNDIASRMFLLSEALGAKHVALEKAIQSRNQIFDRSSIDMNEGFENAMPSAPSMNDRIRTDNEIDRLRTAIEQNDAVVDQISNESTMTSAKFVGALFAMGAFAAISFYSLRK
jgi:hypothetical protein